KACLQDLGGLDKDFFLYYEDVDFCQRAWARGWSVWYEPALAAVHHQPLHARAVPPHLRFLTRHGLLTYAGKHWPGWQLRLLAGRVGGGAGVRGRGRGGGGAGGAAACFDALGALAADLAGGRKGRARRRVERAVRRFGHPPPPPLEKGGRGGVPALAS